MISWVHRAFVSQHVYQTTRYHLSSSNKPCHAAPHLQAPPYGQFMPYHGSQPLSDKDGKVGGRHSDPAGWIIKEFTNLKYVATFSMFFSGFPLLPFMLTSSCDVDTGSPGPPQDAHTHM